MPTQHGQMVTGNPETLARQRERPADPGPTRRALLVRLALLCAVIRLALEVVGLVSLAVHGQDPWTHVLDLWRQWDAPHYLRLAGAGYHATSPPPDTDDQYFIVFFPFYPLVVHLLSLVVLDVTAAALLVSFAASVGAGYFLFRLVALDAGEPSARDSARRRAWRAVVLLYAFPTAYFLAAPFTEALFLCAVTSAVYAARTGWWNRAGLAGALATGTRVTGLALVPALVVEAWFSTDEPRLRLRRMAWAGTAVAGFAVYLVINVVVFGDPLHFLAVQREHWFQGAVPPWQPLVEAVSAVADGEDDPTFAFIYFGRILGFVLAVPLLAVGVRRLRIGDSVYGWAGLVLLLSAAWLVSLPRYLLVLYPLFVVGAASTRRRIVFVPVVVTAAVVQGWLMSRYAVGEWTF